MLKVFPEHFNAEHQMPSAGEKYMCIKAARRFWVQYDKVSLSGALIQPPLVCLVVKQSHGASENKHGNMLICVLCNLFKMCLF